MSHVDLKAFIHKITINCTNNRRGSYIPSSAFLFMLLFSSEKIADKCNRLHYN